MDDNKTQVASVYMVYTPTSVTNYTNFKLSTANAAFHEDQLAVACGDYNVFVWRRQTTNVSVIDDSMMAIIRGNSDSIPSKVPEFRVDLEFALGRRYEIEKPSVVNLTADGKLLLFIWGLTRYDSLDGTLDSPGLWGRVYNRDLRAWVTASQFNLNATTTGDQKFVVGERLDDLKFLVVFESPDESCKGIWYRIFSPANEGDLVNNIWTGGYQHRVNSVQAFDQTNPRVLHTPGKIIICWDSEHETGSYIICQFVNASTGTFIGPNIIMVNSLGSNMLLSMAYRSNPEGFPIILYKNDHSAYHGGLTGFFTHYEMYTDVGHRIRDLIASDR